MIRKLVTVGALVMFSKYLMGHLVPMYATLVCMVMTMRYRPYRRREADKADALLLFAQFSIQLAILLFQFRGTTLYDDSDTLVFAMTWILFLYAFAVAAY